MNSLSEQFKVRGIQANKNIKSTYHPKSSTQVLKDGHQKEENGCKWKNGDVIKNGEWRSE